MFPKESKPLPQTQWWWDAAESCVLQPCEQDRRGTGSEARGRGYEQGQGQEELLGRQGRLSQETARPRRSFTYRAATRPLQK